MIFQCLECPIILSDFDLIFYNIFENIYKAIWVKKSISTGVERHRDLHLPGVDAAPGVAGAAAGAAGCAGARSHHGAVGGAAGRHARPLGPAVAGGRGARRPPRPQLAARRAELCASNVGAARRRPRGHQSDLPAALLLHLRGRAQHAAAAQGPLPLVQGHADPLQHQPPGAVAARPPRHREERRRHPPARHPGLTAAAGAQDRERRRRRLRDVRQTLSLPGTIFVTFVLL